MFQTTGVEWVKLLEYIIENNSFDLFPILADALDDAGFVDYGLQQLNINETILFHLRNRHIVCYARKAIKCTVIMELQEILKYKHSK